MDSWSLGHLTVTIWEDISHQLPVKGRAFLAWMTRPWLSRVTSPILMGLGTQLLQREPGMKSLGTSEPCCNLLPSAVSITVQTKETKKQRLQTRGTGYYWWRFSLCKQPEWFVIIRNAATGNTLVLCCQFEWLHARLWLLQTFSSPSHWQVVIHTRSNVIQAILNASSILSSPHPPPDPRDLSPEWSL